MCWHRTGRSLRIGGGGGAGRNIRVTTYVGVMGRGGSSSCALGQNEIHATGKDAQHLKRKQINAQ
eukprot:6553479-Heterocapsa_arctica.AAC.1